MLTVDVPHSFPFAVPKVDESANTPNWEIYDASPSPLPQNESNNSDAHVNSCGNPRAVLAAAEKLPATTGVASHGFAHEGVTKTTGMDGVYPVTAFPNKLFQELRGRGPSVDDVQKVDDILCPDVLRYIGSYKEELRADLDQTYFAVRMLERKYGYRLAGILPLLSSQALQSSPHVELLVMCGFEKANLHHQLTPTAPSDSGFEFAHIPVSSLYTAINSV